MDYASKLLMDIQSLQNFGTVQSVATNNQSSALFSTILGEILNQSSSYKQETVPLQYHGQQSAYMPNSLQDVLAKPTLHQVNIRYFTNKVQQRHEVDANFQSSASNDHSISNGTPYASIIKEASERFSVPEKLIASIIKHESNFNPNVVSHAGATGLMQLMPGTAKYIGVQNRLDPKENIFGGTKYLKQMLTQFDNDFTLALAAYNAGPGNVKKFGGVPPFQETQNYIKKVMNTYTS